MVMMTPMLMMMLELSSLGSKYIPSSSSSQVAAAVAVIMGTRLAWDHRSLLQHWRQGCWAGGVGGSKHGSVAMVVMVMTMLMMTQSQ